MNLCATTKRAAGDRRVNRADPEHPAAHRGRRPSLSTSSSQPRSRGASSHFETQAEYFSDLSHAVPVHRGTVTAAVVVLGIQHQPAVVRSCSSRWFRAASLVGAQVLRNRYLSGAGIGAQVSPEFASGGTRGCGRGRKLARAWAGQESANDVHLRMSLRPTCTPAMSCSMAFSLSSRFQFVIVTKWGRTRRLAPLVPDIECHRAPRAVLSRRIIGSPAFQCNIIYVVLH